MSEYGIIWYNKDATDHRVWCVKRGGVTVRAARVSFDGDGETRFAEEGHLKLQPGGPRGVVWATNVKTHDEVSCD